MSTLQDQLPFSDDLGPFKVIQVHEPSVGLHAVLVVDNVAAGPSIGGLRMAPDVSIAECARLARAMTFKNAAAGLPHGGGKSVMMGDPHMSIEAKEPLVRAFASALRNEESYIFGPDMGTNEQCMAWVKDEIGRAVGLPRAVGGIPLDEIGATALGLKAAAKVAEDYCEITLAGARVVIQGFGSVGQHAARFLAAEGSALVGVADSSGSVANPDGLDVARLIELKKAGGKVIDYDPGRAGAPDAVIDIPCEIWIPAARPDVITKANVGRLSTSLILQGANIPITPEAEQTLHDTGVVSVPDFIANAGGVICGALEYAGATESATLVAIEEKVGANTREVLERSQSEKTLPREAAVAMATERVRKAMNTRRWSVF
jgi:glutamate dehydrogenase (NAD(P)+)